MFIDVQVQHELPQRPVQPGDRTAHQRKARTRQLRRRFKIQIAMLLTQGDVILNRKIELARRPPAANLDVVILILADRYPLIRQVGHAQHQRIQFSLNGFQLLLGVIQFASHALHIGKQRLNVFTLGLGMADGFGAAVALSLQRFCTRLHTLAPGFKLFELRDIQNKAAAGEAFSDELRLATDQFWIKHDSSSYGCG